MQSLDQFQHNNNNNKVNNSETVLERSYKISARFTTVRNIQTKWKLIDRWFQGCSVFLLVVQDLTYLHNCLSALIFMPDPISSEMGETLSSSSLLGEQVGDSPSPRERLEFPVVSASLARYHASFLEFLLLVIYNHSDGSQKLLVFHSENRCWPCKFSGTC